MNTKISGVPLKASKESKRAEMLRKQNLFDDTKEEIELLMAHMMENLPVLLWYEAIFQSLFSWMIEYREGVVANHLFKDMYDKSAQREFHRRDQMRNQTGMSVEDRWVDRFIHKL